MARSQPPAHQSTHICAPQHKSKPGNQGFEDGHGGARPRRRELAASAVVLWLHAEATRRRRSTRLGLPRVKAGSSVQLDPLFGPKPSRRSRPAAFEQQVEARPASGARSSCSAQPRTSSRCRWGSVARVSTSMWTRQPRSPSDRRDCGVRGPLGPRPRRRWPPPVGAGCRAVRGTVGRRADDFKLTARPEGWLPVTCVV